MSIIYDSDTHSVISKNRLQSKQEETKDSCFLFFFQWKQNKAFSFLI